MGAHARQRGATVPLQDLLIAATALRLDLPMLTVDSDFDRVLRLAREDAAERRRDGGHLWRRLRPHPACEKEQKQSE